jgi:hypothetical protein
LKEWKEEGRGTVEMYERETHQVTKKEGKGLKDKNASQNEKKGKGKTNWFGVELLKENRTGSKGKLNISKEKMDEKKNQDGEKYKTSWSQWVVFKKKRTFWKYLSWVWYGPRKTVSLRNLP